ncbi:MAG TPA: ABC transporter ATP-binding protein [Alicyclobacillus sp.]|nr:ABC transporter ATP-binding protein [Alicyclobacillus sp.]
MEKPLLVANEVKKYFKRKKDLLLVIDGLNLTVENGEFVSLLGPSGCGKSTFLRLVAGLDNEYEGELTLDGVRVYSGGRDRGVVFQQYSLFPWMSAWQNVAFSLRGDRSISKQARKELAFEFLRLVGLSGYESLYPSQMSGGMQQRVAIARALVFRPKLLLMDEPFGALDAQTRHDMQDLLLQVWEQEKCSVLFITHDVDEATYLSDRIYVMSSRPGKIVEEIHVNMARPRDWNDELSPEFLRIKKVILEKLRRGPNPAAEDDTVSVEMIT